MSDFLTRAAKMALGVRPSVKPLIASRYAPGPETPSLESDVVVEDSRLGYAPSPRQVETRRSSFTVARLKSESAPFQPALGRSSPVREMTPADPLTPPVSEFRAFEVPLAADIRTPPPTSPLERSENLASITQPATSGEVVSAPSAHSNSIAESNSEPVFVSTPTVDSRAIVSEPQPVQTIDDRRRISSEELTITPHHPPRSFREDLHEVTLRSLEHTSDEGRTTERVVDSLNTTTLVPVRERSFAEVSNWQPPAQTTQTTQAAPPVAPVVRVTIGRIEVQAAPPPLPPPEPPAPAGPKMSLDEYLRQYNGRRQ